MKRYIFIVIGVFVGVVAAFLITACSSGSESKDDTVTSGATEEHRWLPTNQSGPLQISVTGVEYSDRAVTVHGAAFDPSFDVVTAPPGATYATFRVRYKNVGHVPAAVASVSVADTKGNVYTDADYVTETGTDTAVVPGDPASPGMSNYVDYYALVPDGVRVAEYVVYSIDDTGVSADEPAIVRAS